MSAAVNFDRNSTKYSWIQRVPLIGLEESLQGVEELELNVKVRLYDDRKCWVEKWGVHLIMEKSKADSDFMFDKRVAKVENHWLLKYLQRLLHTKSADAAKTEAKSNLGFTDANYTQFDGGEVGVELVESMEAQRMKKKKKYNLCKSIAWDSAFFTSAGLLLLIISTMMGGGKHMLLGIDEDIHKSTNSISTLASDNLTLENLEADLFGDIRASIQRSTKRSDVGNSTSEVVSLETKNTSIPCKWDFCFYRGSVVEHLNGHIDIIHKKFIQQLATLKPASGRYVITPVNQGRESLVKHMLAIDWKFWKVYLRPLSARSITIRMLERIAGTFFSPALRELFRAKAGKYSSDFSSSDSSVKTMLP
ncbi:hypothetical protein DKX38_029226 [Salix brachista]|uniref:START domain-containing protein n=1 Tax=Salix brachista TaxID=2182728 RepID=A0A5N5IYL3_9ROSI|nr:hypothetical protein DKX38_029226 [Salix brachista]